MGSYTNAGRQATALEQSVAAGEHLNMVYGTQWTGDFDSNPLMCLIRDEWLIPATEGCKIALEIGAGGGRWSRFWINRVEKAILVDGTPACEIATRHHLQWDGLEFLVSRKGTMPSIADASIDYCFSFDTFVHFEPPLFGRYISEIGRVLRPGGILHLHYARVWPENPMNDHESYKYRAESDVADMLSRSGLQLTERRHEIRVSNGSLLIEARAR